MLLISGTNFHTTLFTTLIKREYQRMVPRTIVDLRPDAPRDALQERHMLHSRLSLSQPARTFAQL